MAHIRPQLANVGLISPGETLRILVLSINYWPDETGIAAFNIWRCEYLAARGHQVTICTGPPYYPEWRVPEPYRGKLFQREQRNGVTILRSWMYVPQVVSSKKRILHEASYLVSSFARALSSQRPDLIYVISPPLGLAVTASALASLWRVPFVFDVMDLQPDAAVELGMMKGQKLIDSLYRVERLAYSVPRWSPPSRKACGSESWRRESIPPRSSCFRRAPTPRSTRCASAMTAKPSASVTDCRAS